MSPNSEPDETNRSIPPNTEDIVASDSAPHHAKAPLDKHRYAAGMLIYLVLALLAGLTLDGNIRLATWIFLGGLAVKTLLAVLKDSRN
ncbi:MAG: hypothetical protein ABL967_00775 [Bryobacteraceae bacterium]